MRVFLAIDLSDGMRGRLADAIARLAPSAQGVKWVSRDQLHLTLVFFFGKMTPTSVQEVAAAVRAICAESEPFSCEVKGYGFWRKRGRPVCVWADVVSVSKLESFQARLIRESARLGFQVDARRFRPHITLGRCKELVENRLLLQAMKQDRAADFGRLDVSRITFYESRLRPQGPDYRVMMKIPLGAAPASLAIDCERE